MMKKNKKTTAANQSSNQTRELNIVMNDQTSRYKLHPECCARLADGLPLWVPPEIFFEVTDGLRGFRKGLANVMVENILMFCTGSGRHLTGLPHVDNVLLELYRHIGSFAVINGYKLEPLF